MLDMTLVRQVVVTSICNDDKNYGMYDDEPWN